MTEVVTVATTEQTRLRRRTRRWDRIAVALYSLAGFLLLLALLVSQMHVTAQTPRPHVVLLRKIYQTTVVETVRGSAVAGTSVSQSSSSSGSTPSLTAAPAPTTRVS